MSSAATKAQISENSAAKKNIKPSNIKKMTETAAAAKARITKAASDAKKNIDKSAALAKLRIDEAQRRNKLQAKKQLEAIKKMKAPR